MTPRQNRATDDDRRQADDLGNPQPTNATAIQGILPDTQTIGAQPFGEKAPE
jgi:hypothetical protein